MTRKKNKSARYFGITVAVVLALFILFLTIPSIQKAFAVTQADIDTMKLQIQDLENRKDILTETIKNQHKIVNKNKWNIADQWQLLHTLKQQQNESWDAAQQLGKEQSNLFDLVNEYRDSRNRLHELLTERSDYIKDNKILKKQLIILQKEFDDSIVKVESTLAKKIGIVLDNGCLTMIKNNFNTTCPSYKDLYSLDNSLTEISGEFITNDDGFFHRGNEQYKNSYRFYDNDSTPRLFIDPPAQMLDRIKLIEIRQNFDTYFDRGEKQQHQQFEYIDVIINATKFSKAVTVQVQNQTQEYGRIIYNDRYIDSCRIAYINADKWQELLPLTIQLLRNNCDESFKVFEEKQIIPINATVQDITTSQKWKDDQRMIWIKENCLTVYGACK